MKRLQATLADGEGRNDEMDGGREIQKEAGRNKKRYVGEFERLQRLDGCNIKKKKTKSVNDLNLLYSLLTQICQG